MSSKKSSSRVDPSAFDVRIVERNISRGAVSAQEYREYLESLEDVAAKATAVEEPQPLEPTEGEPESAEP